MAFGCCKSASIMVLDENGQPDPALIRARVDRDPEHRTIEGTTELAVYLAAMCACDCHRNIPGQYTMC